MFPPVDPPDMSPRHTAILLYASLGLFAVLALARIVASGPVPWLLVGGSALAVAVLAGPVAWIARDRLPASRRAVLFRVVLLVGTALFTLSLGVSLAFGVPFLFVSDGVLVGATCGTAVARLAERTVVPDRYRAGGS